MTKQEYKLNSHLERSALRIARIEKFGPLGEAAWNRGMAMLNSILDELRPQLDALQKRAEAMEALVPE